MLAPDLAAFASLNQLLQIGQNFGGVNFNFGNINSNINQVIGQAQGFISNIQSIFGGFF